MSTTIDGAPGVGVSIARRALELARDANVTLEEAADHLGRLAKGRSFALELALAEVSRSPDRGATLEHARILLRRALRDALQPPLYGGFTPAGDR